MIGDWLETMIDRPGFAVNVHPRGSREFEVSGNDAGAMTALLLRRRREASGASLREMASRLGESSSKCTQVTSAATPSRLWRNSTLYSRRHRRVAIS